MSFPIKNWFSRLNFGSGKPPVNGGFNRKITYQWSIWQHAMFDYRRGIWGNKSNHLGLCALYWEMSWNHHSQLSRPLGLIEHTYWYKAPLCQNVASHFRSMLGISCFTDPLFFPPWNRHGRVSCLDHVRSACPNVRRLTNMAGYSHENLELKKWGWIGNHLWEFYAQNRVTHQVPKDLPFELPGRFPGLNQRPCFADQVPLVLWYSTVIRSTNFHLR